MNWYNINNFDPPLSEVDPFAMGFNRVVFGLLLVLFGVHLRYNDAVVFKMTNAVCKSNNKSWVTINECRLRAISRNKTTFNFNGTILHPAYNIDQEFHLLKKYNGYKPWVIKTFTVDCCQYMRKPYNPTAILINALFKEFSNINHSCPYVGVQLVQGFYLRPELLRLPFPTGEYLLKINWMFNKKQQFFTNVYFSFIEDYIDM